MEPIYTPEEKQRMIEEHAQKQKRLYTHGKIIVTVIAMVNIVGTIAASFLSFNLFQLIIQIVLSIALLMGVSWVRYLFAVGAALSCFLSFYLLLATDYSLMSASGKALLISYLIFTLCYSIISCILLFTSKSVSEFLYAQKNG